MKTPTFKISWRRKFLWKSARFEGLQHLEKQDRMILITKTGVHEIPRWSECECKLGKDFLAHMERERQK